jgi:HK97 family phage major capsid protein
MFPGAAHDLAGWGSNSEYLFAIGRGLHDSRLRADSQNEGTSSLGGFLTPPSFFGQVSNSSLESEIVRSRCVVYPMTTRELDIPRFDDLDRSAGAIAGLTLQPVGEGVTMTPQVAKLGLLRLAARKMGLFVEASNELMSDGVAFETTLTSGLARALSFGLDRALLFGAGTGGPQGALSSPVTITVARQKAGAILYDDVLGMFARLAPGCVNTAIWIAHSSTLPSLASLSLVIGVGGSAVPALQQANGTWSLLGRPLLLSEKVSPLGTEADLCLCDFQRYALGVRRDASLDRSVDAGFQRDVTNFRFLIRVDGMPLDPAPITPLSGPTVSPFIKLGAAE